MRKAVALLLALLVVACDGAEDIDTTVAPGTTTGANPAPTSTLPPPIECPGVGDFAEGGGIADIPGEGSDSRSLGQISWETSDQCETFHFDFETSEGAPATSAPEIQVDHLETFQVIRVNIDVQGTVVTDQLVETALVDRLYVVRSLSGGMFVDLHMAQPAAVRASVSSSPARLSLELRPGFVPFEGRSAVDDTVVLTSPPSGATVDSDVQLLGYSRSSDGNVLTVATQGGEVVAEANTTAAGDRDTWGEYRVELRQLPPGKVTVFVGEEGSAGGLDGLTVDLNVS